MSDKVDKIVGGKRQISARWGWVILVIVLGLWGPGCQMGETTATTTRITSTDTPQRTSATTAAPAATQHAAATPHTGIRTARPTASATFDGRRTETPEGTLASMRPPVTVTESMTVTLATTVRAKALATATTDAFATPTLAGSAPEITLPPSRPGVMPPQVYEVALTIPTYGYEAGFVETEPEDPVYPYPRIDFPRIGPPGPREYTGIVLENSYVMVTILPELGGRVYQWIDKGTGRHLLYENPVIKPTEWGQRGWWLAAGGIEWAFPVDEHGLNEWRPWQYQIERTGSKVAVTVSDLEDRTGMTVGATIGLDAAHAYVTLQPWARNGTEQAHPYQLWLNGMLTLGGNAVSPQTEFVIPATKVQVHSSGDGSLPGPGEWMDWPNYQGRDLSHYGNWRAHLGFFVPAPRAGFVGLYDHAADQGMVRVFTPGWPAGTKLFGPAGLPPTMWTDDGSHYVELWSGATASFWDDALLNPGESVSWTERWYPIKGVGGLDDANEAAALCLQVSEGDVEVGVAVTTFTHGTLVLSSDEAPVAQWELVLAPGAAFRANWTASTDWTGALGLQLIGEDGQTLIQTERTP